MTGYSMRACLAMAAGVVLWGCGGSAVLSRVERVESGDLVVLRSGERLRLAGIEAPLEGHDRFEESRGLLERIVLDKKLKITRFGEDVDGAVIAEIHVDGLSVSKMMLILSAAEERARKPITNRR
ncbi:MAG TPA: hypothetical protein ENN09_05950 [Planctomycetes bacterium]|nr:hypothetical protein [Planctomycetota bacterium]